MASEKLFENKVKRWLHSQGVYAAGTPSSKMEIFQVGWFVKVFGGGFQKAGIPDLLICANGFFISVELKASTGKPSELQKLNTARINRSKGIGIILYPEGFERFKEIMKGVLRCNFHIVEFNVLKHVHSSTSCVIWMG